MFWVLAWRDVAVRYKQTVVGIGWAVIRPFLTMFVFTVVFGGIAKLPSTGNAPYALLVLSGLLPWSLFASSFSDASNSLIANSNLISKVYFPRMIVPVAAITVAVVDFVFSCIVLVGVCLFYQYVPSVKILLLPFFLLLAVFVCLGPSLWVAAINVKYRDFRYVVPFIVQLGLYATPVGFSSGAIPEKYKMLLFLNPMVGVIEGFRWLILRDSSFPGFSILLSMGIASGLLWIGVRQFRAMEASFADVI